MRDSRVLALLGCALVVLAGCTGGPAPPPARGDTPGSSDSTVSPDTPPGTTPTPGGVAYESYVFDHAGTSGSAVEGGITYPTDGEYVTQFYATVVDSASAAERFDHAVLDAGASAFVRNTSFEESTLVVVQAFPASSVPDYRVESVRRTSGGLDVRINDSSAGGTADITVETLLLRIHGDAPATVTVTTEEGRTFDTTAGIVTVTPDPTPTPEPEIELPYASDDPGENVDEPRSLRIVNHGSETNGYRVRVVYRDRPDCRAETPTCDEPTRTVELFERRGKLLTGANVTVPELAVREGTYAVTASAEVPAGNGSRVTVTDTLEWTLGESSGDLLVAISDDDVSVEDVDG